MTHPCFEISHEEKNYLYWLTRCTRIALMAGHVINPDKSYWEPKYQRGISPEEAIEELAVDLGEDEKKQYASETRE